MAARKTRTLTESWKEKIQTSMLINRLQDFVKGEIELQPHQVTAALGLLKKTAPDLSAVTGGGGPGMVVTFVLQNAPNHGKASQTIDVTPLQITGMEDE